MIAFTALFELLYARNFTDAKSQLGSLFSVSEPSPEERFTMRPASERRSSGSSACVTRTTPKTFVS